MLCKSYAELSHLEKVTLVGEIVHCVQSSDDCFKYAKALIKTAKESGVFNGVCIEPERRLTPDEIKVAEVIGGVQWAARIKPSI